METPCATVKPSVAAAKPATANTASETVGRSFGLVLVG